MCSTCKLLSIALIVFAVGCSARSGPPIAPVSGKVTVDGQPMADIIVTFEPLTTDASADQRATSLGITDAQGRFVLKGGGEQFNGALVGKHRVRLAKKEPQLMDELDPNYNARNEMKKLKNFKQLPKKYNASSDLTIDVPASGTHKAAFDISLK